jgi:hypothetical protein
VKKILQLLKIKIKFLFLLLIFLGISAFGIFEILNSRTTKIIEKMISKMERVKSLEGRMNFYFNQGNDELFSVSLFTQGREDYSQKENRKSEMIFKINYFFQSENSKISFGYAGERKLIGKVIYLKFNQLPENQNYFLFPKEQWVKIDPASFVESIKKISEGGIPPEKEKEYQEQFEMINRERGNQGKLSGPLLKKEVLRVKKRMKDEKIGKIKTYHYLITLKGEEILKIISEEMRDLTPEKRSNLENLKKFYEKIGDIEGEIWIGKRDFLLYKISLEKSLNLEKEKITLRINLEFSNYNSPIEINPPVESKNIEEILFSSLEEYKKEIENLEAKTKDVQIISQILQIITLAKGMKVKENSFEEICQGKTLNEEISQLREIEKEIKKLQDEKLNLSCYSSSDSFCVSVDLIQLNKGKLCIDSSENIKEIYQDFDCIGKGTKEDPYRCP